MSSYYRVHSDRLVEELRNTVDDDENLGNFMHKLKEKLKISIISLDEETIVFDLIGVDVSIANALRRILLAEVPTISIENVWISVNHSIVQDEVLAHRIGLIPIKADPRKLDFVNDPNEEATETDTIVFHLDVTCPNPPSDITEEEKRNFSYKVMSESIEWHPAGNQENVFPEGVKPVNKDIVITVLRPGQQLEFEAHAVKGIGKDHTKFSPVATASYRLMPDISFSEKVINDRAYELRDMCPMGVFDIEDIKLPGTTEKVPTAVASRPRDCTMCRECIRNDGWSDSVILRRKADHFIFSVESTGCIPAADVVEEAISILKAKASKFYHLADEYVEA